MTEEKPTPQEEDVDVYTMDDATALRFVLQHVRGSAPVSVYNQSEYLIDTDETA